MKVLAPAKINLGLEIGEKNINGYHEVDMIMQSISLCDEIEISKSCDSKTDVISNKKIGCSTEKNIAYRAAQEFFEYTKIKNNGVIIKIKKNIPMRAGLAGGSADGAGVIVGLDRMFETRLNLSQMCQLAAKVGSDVPFCVLGGTALATGTGTCLNSINSMPKCHIVVIKPEISVSTAEAYARFDNLKSAKKHDMNLLESAVESNDLIQVCSNLYNRFEEVMDSPEIISDIKQNLKKFGALGSLMTGSGSAIYGIFDNINRAQNCVQKLQGKYDFIQLVEPINHGAYSI